MEPLRVAESSPFLVRFRFKRNLVLTAGIPAIAIASTARENSCCGAHWRRSIDHNYLSKPDIYVHNSKIAARLQQGWNALFTDNSWQF